MKCLSRLALCAGLLAALLCTPALAAEAEDGATPAPQGDFAVLVNGETVSFPDATPQMKDNRSCLPFVAVFDALGFPQENVTWDNDTRTVTATRGDTTVSLTIGQTQISLTQGEETATYETDVAPYLADNRTYIPVGLVADVLGYRVGWDSLTRTVIIDDVDAILAANTETYDLMDRYLDYGRRFSGGNQQVTGSYAMNFSLDAAPAEGGGSFTFDLSGDYEELVANQSALQFTTELDMDYTATLDGEDLAGQLEADGLALPGPIQLELRGDALDGTFYLHMDGEGLAELTGWDTSLWYKLDLRTLYDQVYGAGFYDQLMALASATTEMDFADTLALMLQTTPLTSAQFTTTDALALYNAMFADSAFERSGANYVNTFFEELGLPCTFTLYTSGNQVTGYGLEMSAAVEGVTLSLDAQMRGQTMEMDMGLQLDGGEDFSMALTMTMDGTYRTTTAQPETEPPAGATWVDPLATEAGGSAGDSASELVA